MDWSIEVEVITHLDLEGLKAVGSDKNECREGIHFSRG